MAHLRGTCSNACDRDKRDCWHHPNTKIVRQFKNGNWLLENPRGHIRGAETDKVVFDEGEYETHKDPHTFEFTYTDDNPFELDDPRRDLWATIYAKNSSAKFATRPQNLY
tara:strand:+ start:396 stop:725 length:330 start_codon:yes stop_codon:yes gene_type:complete